MKRRSGFSIKWFFWGFLILILLGIGSVLAIKLEGEPPAVAMDLDGDAFGTEGHFILSARDPGSGLRRVRVDLTADDKSVVLLEKSFPAKNFIRGGSVKRLTQTIKFDLKSAGMPDGEATIRITAVDHAWRDWLGGNRTLVKKPILIDTKRPQIRIFSDVHNIEQGGSGLVIYSLNESCPKHGVQAGDFFYQGYPAAEIFGKTDPAVFMAFIALNHDQGRGTDLFLLAEDRAGNRSKAGFPHYIRDARFRQSTIPISDRFLESKLPEFEPLIPDLEEKSLGERFLWINRELRRQNNETFLQVCSKSEPVIYWEKEFLRLPKSARQSSFADQRTYQYNGEIIDHQVHLGIDLAALSRTPVPAANHGKVLFAGPVGIYGKTVVIDHGFGLCSTYSHLSGIDVGEGDMVEKEEIIGRTGITGLAGGDHLHFGMMIQNIFVDPVEWWDRKWIENNITDKIETVRVELRARGLESREQG